MEMVNVVKSQNVNLILKSQTLTSFIFKFNLNFEKIECRYMFERSRLVKKDKMVQSENVDFWFKKVNV